MWSNSVVQRFHFTFRLFLNNKNSAEKECHGDISFHQAMILINDKNYAFCPEGGAIALSIHKKSCN
jgi:hypothetical protein